MSSRIYQKAWLLPLLFLLTRIPAGAQAREMTEAAGKITELVTTTLQQAAARNTKEAGDIQAILRTNLGEAAEAKGTTITIPDFVQHELCTAPNTVRAYIVRVQDIIDPFPPPTTGPTYPEGGIAAFQVLQERIRSDRRLSEEEREELLAFTEGIGKFIQAMQDLHDRYPAYFDGAEGPGLKTGACSSWWCRWGKCAAGIFGGGLTGGLTGAGGTSMVPVVGPVAESVLGIIGSALGGAPPSCD